MCALDCTHDDTVEAQKTICGADIREKRPPTMFRGPGARSADAHARVPRRRRPFPTSHAPPFGGVPPGRGHSAGPSAAPGCLRAWHLPPDAAVRAPFWTDREPSCGGGGGLSRESPREKAGRGVAAGHAKALDSRPDARSAGVDHSDVRLPSHHDAVRALPWGDWPDHPARHPRWTNDCSVPGTASDTSLSYFGHASVGASDRHVSTGTSSAAQRRAHRPRVHRMQGLLGFGSVQFRLTRTPTIPIGDAGDLSLVNCQQLT